jgi:hypothetical protein
MKKLLILICCFISTQVFSTPTTTTIYKIQGSVGKYIEFNLAGVNSEICKQGASFYTRVNGLPEGLYRKGCIISGKPKYSGTSRLSFLSEDRDWIAELVVTGRKPNPTLLHNTKQSITPISTRPPREAVESSMVLRNPIGVNSKSTNSIQHQHKLKTTPTQTVSNNTNCK